MNKEELTTLEIYETVQRIEYVNMEEFSKEYCNKSASYIRTMRAKGYELPTAVLVSITNKLLEKELTLTWLAAQDKALLAELIEKLATMIAKRQTLHEHVKLRKMLMRIVNELNEEKKKYDIPPIFVM
ncbi:DUF6626 family protein [Neptuniibacter sp. QD29_5]|uniref:DUF6626 family protein n=1 Tax=Neptuniibacter sp. QD29_5 TaxID=3398207 RepID=UPI0039F5B8AE